MNCDSFFYFLNIFNLFLALLGSLLCRLLTAGFSCWGAQALCTWASVVLACRLCTYGSWAQSLCSMWNAPGPRIEFMLPTLASRLPSTVPWGKSCFELFFKNLCCCCLVIQPCLTLCDPMDCSMPGFTCLLEFPQIHVHYVGDAIQPSHPLSPHSPPVLSLSQHQGLFQWVVSLHQVAKVLELQL